MPDESHMPTDDQLLADLTVGQFKQLILTLLTQHTEQSHRTEARNLPSQADTTIEPDPITVRRKSLDEFMDDLNNHE